MATVVSDQPAAPPTTLPVAVAPPPVATAAPRITATRRLLTRRFTSLGFTVSSGARPFWEVLLFTDRTLIDPAHASRRTPSTFYASRQDGGLRPGTTTDDALFIVPSAVLRGFAAAVPKPSAIYYTVATYAAADGTNPMFPEPPTQLALDAPSVQVASDFTTDTVDAVLGVSANRLRVVAQAAATDPATAPTVGTPSPAPTNGAAPPTLTPVDDVAGGEDGFSYLATHPEPTSVPAAPAPTPAAPTTAAPAPAPVPRPGPGPGPADGYEHHHRDDHDAAAGDDDYDDGFGDQGGWAAGQAAAFPAGYIEPDPLIDEDAAPSGWAPPSQELAGVASAHQYHALDEPSPDAGTVPVAAAAPPPPAAAPAVAAAPLTLTIDDKRAIIERIAGSESGADRYGAINADGEFKGRFGPDHPAYQRFHVGLSYGIVQFAQDGGSLGVLLTMMRARDAATFAQTFGPHSDELVTVTTAAGPPASQCPDGRSARTQPVDGADLWEEPWISRFRAAGQVTAFQAAQNELAATQYVDPMLPFCGNFGLDTDRAVTICVDRSVQMGVGGAQQWIAAAVGPIATPTLRQQALSAVGATDLASFQSSHGVTADNIWGPQTHAALVGAIRALGAASPIPLPTVDQMLDSITRRADADGVTWANRVKTLRGATGFTDQPYAR